MCEMSKPLYSKILYEIGQNFLDKQYARTQKTKALAENCQDFLDLLFLNLYSVPVLNEIIHNNTVYKTEYTETLVVANISEPLNYIWNSMIRTVTNFLSALIYLLDVNILRGVGGGGGNECPPPLSCTIFRGALSHIFLLQKILRRT